MTYAKLQDLHFEMISSHWFKKINWFVIEKWWGGVTQIKKNPTMLLHQSLSERWTAKKWTIISRFNKM